jgi:hypothetical protein
LQTRHDCPRADAALLMQLQRTAKHQVGAFLRQQVSPGPGL